MFLASLPANLIKLAYAPPPEMPPPELPPGERIVSSEFPMTYLPEPVRAQELRSKVSGAIITYATRDFPTMLIKAKKASELRSKFELPPLINWDTFMEEWM